MWSGIRFGRSWCGWPGVSEGATVIHKGGGHFHYKPAEGFTGTDTFTYTITDGEATATATVTILVDPLTAPNVPPPDDGGPGPARI
jgi:hypothetical protein